ncbi:MAG: ferrochelatase [Acidobacteriota bacterium]|nr:MAG: ferrochelatase [Acidobacteriota bacterium]
MALESIVLVNLGTPEAPEPASVRAFLEEFLSDPMVVDYPTWLWRPVLAKILRSRPERIAKLYRSVWLPEGSPLTAGTRRIADALRATTGADVTFAFRYTQPALTRVLAGNGRPIVVPLFPQRTGSSSGTIEALVGDRATIRRIEPDEPGYISALADLWRQSVGHDPPEHFVASFHSIPVRYDRREGGQYRRDCETTYRALLARMGWPEEKATLAFQSRFGPEPWIGPKTAAVLQKLPRAGIKSVAVATPGFLTEGLETLEEIGMRGRQTFERAGGERFCRVPCVEAHPAFVRSLADALVDKEVAG